jgi:hypothetical protein
MADRTITTDLIARDRMGPAFDSAARKASNAGDKFRVVTGALHQVGASAVNIAGAGIKAVGGFLVQGVKDAASYQTVLKKTEAVLKSTGNVAGTSVGHIKAMAAELESMSGVDEELIINSQNVLATFTNIRNVGKSKIFDQAAKSALDMSVALGTDLQGASIQVGKALNDPIKGVTALSKVGVSFTQKQKDQIKTLVESGKTMQAQKLILAELSKEFGGAAKAAGSGFEGSIARAKDALADTGREIGIMLLPKLSAAAEWLSAKIPVAVQQFKDGWKGIGAGAKTEMGQLATSLKGLSDQISGLMRSTGNVNENGFVKMAKAVVGAMTTASDGVQLFGANWQIITNKISNWNNIVAINFQKMVNNIQSAGAKLPGPMGEHFRKMANNGKAEINRLQGEINKTNTRIAQAQAEALVVKLRYLGRQKPTPKVQADIRQAQTQLARIRGQINAVRGKTVTIGVIYAVGKKPGSFGNGLGVLRAAGGPLNSGQTALVGEEGPEIIKMGSKPRVIPANRSQALARKMGTGNGGGRGGGDTYVFNVSGVVGNPSEVAEAMVQVFERRAAGGRKIPRSAVA